MARRIVFLLAGVMFGAGLALSGMTDPAKVIGFLDILGRWDPRLAATMAGALGVTALFYRLRRRPLLGGEMPPPPSKVIDLRLVGGSAIFGMGWGLAGICPAPAVAVLAFTPVVLWFLAGLGAGVLLHARVVTPRRRT